MEIKNCNAIVTGGASGLGEATVRRFVSEGCKVAIFDMDQTRGQAIAEELGDAVMFAQVNVSDEKQVDDAVAKVKDKFGTFHVVVNCAGTAKAAKIVDREGKTLPLDFFKSVVDINLIGTYNIIRGSAAALLANNPSEEGERGVCINTASIAAEDGQVGQAAYSSTKGGVMSLSLTLAREFANDGIRFMTIMPGIMNTPMMAGMPEKIKERLAQQVPFPPRLGKPEEFAKLVVDIVENPYLNGGSIRLDGAIRMGFGRK